MSKRRQAGQIVRFVSRHTSVVDEVWLVIQPDPSGKWWPCLHECGDDDCREWANCRVLEGPTLAAALEQAAQQDFIETSPHVSECEMEDWK